MKIAFFGDSITEGFPGSSYFKILEKKLPECTLLNYGKGGDTVVSLYKRIQRKKLTSKMDLAFLWVGVNDILVKTSWTFPILKTLRRQPWAKNETNFKQYYCRILDILTKHAGRVIAVSPLFIGEKLQDTWNRKLKDTAKTIRELSEMYPNTEYLDLRNIFVSLLSGKDTVEFLPNRMIRLFVKKILGKNPGPAENRTTKEGYHFTIDGIHLNNRGAGIVSEAFLEMIKM